MQRSSLRLLIGQNRRGFCTSSEKIVASVLFERLRVVIPKPDPAVYTFQEFKFNWQQQFRRRYPDEFLDIAKNRHKSAHTVDCSFNFVGNAPMAHMAIQPTEEKPDLPSYKRFFFKCSVVAASKYDISNCEDYVWVTKDELLEIFPEQAEFFNKMIMS